MCPTIIADSDDESDTNGHYSPPNPRPVPAATIQALTRSSDHGSLATASTDSAFFQNVFNEQNEAACGHAQESQSGALREDVHQSSAVTIPDVPFHRTTKGFYHSSMTSITEPNTDRYQEMFADRNLDELTQINTPRKDQDHDLVPTAVDPWDVPDSPENSHMTGKSSRARGAHKGSSKFVQAAGAMGRSTPTGPVAHSSWNVQDNLDDRGSKRRRLEESHASSNDVNLIIMPSSHHFESHVAQQVEAAATSSILLPTLPIESDSPFYIPPSDNLPLQDSIISLVPNGVGRNNNLLLQQQTLYAVGSSGTATNMNTPRKGIFSPHNFSSLGPEELDKEIVAKTREYGSLGREWSSSPDAISMRAPEAIMISTLEREPCEGGISVCPTEPPPPVLQSDDKDPELMTKQKAVDKPKKRRGRPKKNSEGDEPQSTELATGLAPEADVPPITEKTKKKRGRPKKHPPPVATDQAPPSPAVSVSTTDVLDASTMVDRDADAGSIRKRDSRAVKGEKGVKESKDVHPAEQPEENLISMPVEENTGGGQDQATWTEKEGVGLHSDSSDVPTMQKHEPKGDTRPLDQGAAQKREEKPGSEGMKKASPAAAGARPAFRVGLSKRWKIAPLLKSVRK
ncbi:hypothetical protein PT974_02622 [Cladobotryum mycophilum]|uniref:AT hook domain-containing protein n=1 Tax=Cladobotryum mycophilum TaxID=491253 RepID=A0ABR0SYN1_9HYPO